MSNKFVIKCNDSLHFNEKSDKNCEMKTVGVKGYERVSYLQGYICNICRVVNKVQTNT